MNLQNKKETGKNQSSGSDLTELKKKSTNINQEGKGILEDLERTEGFCFVTSVTGLTTISTGKGGAGTAESV
jgi:hypothetical protein